MTPISKMSDHSSSTLKYQRFDDQARVYYLYLDQCSQASVQRFEGFMQSLESFIRNFEKTDTATIITRDGQEEEIKFLCRGIALVVSNDYKGTLCSSNNDSSIMKQFFCDLRNYKVIVLRNLLKQQFMKICDYLAKSPRQYPAIYRRFVIYFSGHGGSGYICMPDKKWIKIEELQSKFDKLPLSMAKLFFVDTCHNIRTVEGHYIASVDYRNMLMAYATLNGHASRSTGKGYWTKPLYEFLYLKRASLLQVLTAVTECVETKCEERGYDQTPSFNSTLHEEIWFWKDAGQFPPGEDDDTNLHITKLRLKHCYLYRPMEPTKWPNLKGPVSEHDLDVVINQVSRLSPNSLVKKSAMVTDKDMIVAGHQKITLIEGDPGTGKTTLTIKICKKWAEDKFESLSDDLVFLVPLCDSDFQKVNDLNELFTELGCFGIKQYGQRNNGRGMVFILDGWDELPCELQKKSFYSDMIFKARKSPLSNSTIIVTSRPSCSGHIAEQLKDHYYQIQGFTLSTVKEYIKIYFKDSPQSVQPLLDILKSQDYLLGGHFYIPIVVLIMCFVYNNSGSHLPDTLSKLYEIFVLICIESNISKPLWKNLKSIHHMPKELYPLFNKLCEIALEKLLSQTLEFDEKELTTDDRSQHTSTSAEGFDGFGLLCIKHVPNERGRKEIRYRFIHRAVQELLAAISIINSNSVESKIDSYFRTSSYLINVFPFVFGLMSKNDPRNFAGQLQQKFIGSGRNSELLTIILHCLFEAQDEMLCREFGQVFSEDKQVKLRLRSDLEYCYAAYFLSVCGCKQLKITGLGLEDTSVDMMAKYLYKTSTEIVSFTCVYVKLSVNAIKALDTILSCQHKVKMKIFAFEVISPSCIKTVWDTLRKYCVSITISELVLSRGNYDLSSLSHLISLESLKLLSFNFSDALPNEIIDSPILAIINYTLDKISVTIIELQLSGGTMSKDDLCGLGCLVNIMKSLKHLHILCSYVEGVSLKSSYLLCNALCSTKSLKLFKLGIYSEDDSKAVSEILKKNSSMKSLYIFDVKTIDHLGIIFDGLSLNKTVTMFTAYPSYVSKSIAFEENIKVCLQTNQSLLCIDIKDKHKTLQATPQVNSICTGLQSNSTLVTLDISGWHVDEAASDAVCNMLTYNTSLKYLFLNPPCLEQSEAVAIIGSCRTNTTLEWLSLVKWAGDDVKKGRKEVFIFSNDKEVDDKLREVQKNKGKQIPKVIWDFHLYVAAISDSDNDNDILF